MNKLRKYLSIFICMFITAITLCGCGTKNVNGNITPTADQTAGINNITDKTEPTKEASPTDTPTPEPTKEIKPTDTPTPEPTKEIKPTDTPTPEPTKEIKPTDTPTSEPTKEIKPTDTPTKEPTNEPDKESSVEYEGEYSSKEEVALYIHLYGELPKNYITKNEARDLGWDSKKGNLWEVADKMSIGGDKFGNYEKLLPDKKGRTWYECDIDFDGKYRNAKRIIYSNDGLIYYTEDHYNSFEQLY